jgi:hypothetical protein
LQLKGGNVVWEGLEVVDRKESGHKENGGDRQDGPFCAEGDGRLRVLCMGWRC